MKRSKIAGWCIAHYGKPYIAAAVEAMYDQVDAIFIAYTAAPSQSFSTQMPCPDTQDELLEQIKPFKDKIVWQEGNWMHEWEHCDAARAMAKGYEWLVRFDTDEIFPPGAVQYYIEEAAKTDNAEWRIPFLHFWRSFGKVCKDQSWPVRIEHTMGGTLHGWIGKQESKMAICHMGYASPPNYIEYKMSVSGHHNEWRPDWFQNRFLANAQTDVHPVCFNPPYWNTEDFPAKDLPPVLKNHPYFGREVIE